MTYQEHLAAARQLRPEDIEALLNTLGQDEKFCAVIAWLERNRDAFVSAGSRQDLSGDHGRLAHAQGSVHALHTLMAQLAGALVPPPASDG